MVLSKRGNKYIFRCGYHDRMTAKDARFRWDSTGKECGEKKVWWTDDVKKAAKLIKYAEDQKTGEKIFAEYEKSQKSVHASRATDSNIKIPAPKGCKYMPFQKAGIAYAQDRKNVLFGDEMGLGKTIEVAGVLNCEKEAKKILVVCPASLKINWKRELEKWLVRKAEIVVVMSKDEWPEEADIIIVNYDILKKFPELFKITIGAIKSLRKKATKYFEYVGPKWDFLVVDECHYVKNAKAQRTKMVGKIEAERKLYLTGTPIVNRPVELYPILQTLDPKNWDRFGSLLTDTVERFTTALVGTSMEQAILKSCRRN